LVELAEALATMKPEEIRALASLLSANEAGRDAVAAALVIPRKNAGQAAENIPALLEALWETVLKQHVERWLKALSQEGLIKNAQAPKRATTGEVAMQRLTGR
jgi:hypothetical protein